MDNVKMENAPDLRTGKTINIEEFLDEMYNEYKIDLCASIESFDGYDEVSVETYNDYKTVCIKLEMLEILRYLDKEELDAMRQTAAEMRLKKLEGLEHEENRS